MNTKAFFSGSDKADAHNDNDGQIATGLEQVAASAMAESWMEKAALQKAGAPVSANELVSLSALIAYVAHKLGAGEFGVERDLADRFGVANVKCLPAARFDDAMRYLIDRVPEAAE